MGSGNVCIVQNAVRLQVIINFVRFAVVALIVMILIKRSLMILFCIMEAF